MNRGLLLVDDEIHVLGALQRQLRRDAYNVFEAVSGSQGLDVLKNHEIGVVVSDLTMPEMDGISFLKEVKKISPDTVRILLTGNGTIDNVMNAVNGLHVFAFLTKPWSWQELKGTVDRAFEHYDLVRENKRLLRLTREQNRELSSFNNDLKNLVQRRTRQMEEAIREGIRMLTFAAEAKDDDTGEHVHRIQDLTLGICLELGMSSEQSENISFSSSMHDIGKIHVPDAILKKKGPLNKHERETMKSHTVAGEKILGTLPFYRTAREIARSHHERWDGAGYPDGLKGEGIPLSARIVAVADVFDALTHDRPYKDAWPVERAVEEMNSLKGKFFDPDVLDAFLSNPYSASTLFVADKGEMSRYASQIQA